ncbi:MAG TPA: CopD family protein [Vicinamibacterales bacterium]|nr:CopD family protein [Vicinamibacterales bacterium]
MVFARWVLSVGAIGLVGVFGAGILLRRLQAIAPSVPIDGRMRAVARFGFLLAILFAGAVAWVLLAQLDAWFGSPLPGRQDLSMLLTETYWGASWTDLAGAALLVIGWSTAGVVSRRAAPFAAFLSAMLVVWAVPLVGHGSAHGPLVLWCHRAHLFGVGLWLGTLFVAVVSFGPSRWRPLMTVLLCFRPMALAGAATMLLSGVALAFEHVHQLDALWTTDYGATLAAKIGVTVALLTLGFLNSRRPRIAIVLAEVTSAVLVALLLAARLGELPMPH